MASILFFSDQPVLARGLREILHGEVAGLDVDEQCRLKIDRPQQPGLADAGRADDL